MSTAPLVFVCKTGSITQPSKVDLRKAGVIVVEVDNPSDCKLIRGDAVIDRPGMLGAALRALNSQSSVNGNGAISTAGRQQVQFVKLVGELVDAQEKSQ